MLYGGAGQIGAMGAGRHRPHREASTIRRTRAGRFAAKAEEASRPPKAGRDVSPQAHLASALLLGTGLRVAEVAAAQWRHLVLDAQGNMGLLVVGKGF